MRKTLLLRLQGVMKSLTKDMVTSAMSSSKTKENIATVQNVAYTGTNGNPLGLDIYYRKDLEKEKKPVLIYVHGGGLFVGDRKMSMGVAQLFAEEGFLVFTLSYRLMDEATATEEIGDIVSGFCQASCNILSYNGDKENVFVVGESAGAFLSLYALTQENSKVLGEKLKSQPTGLTVKGCSFLSGMFYTNRKDFIGRLYPKTIYRERLDDKAFLSLMDPESKEVMDHLPPAYLTTSKGDFLRHYTLAYAKALERNGNTVVLDDVDNKDLKHAYLGIVPDLPESAALCKRISQWFMNR